MYLPILDGVTKMMIFSTIKQYIIAGLGFIMLLLTGALFYQKKRADRNAQEIEDLENEIQANDITNEVRNFQNINRERKDHADEKINDADTHTHIEPNTTYSL